MTTAEQFQALLGGVEGRRLEFKTAAGGFHFEELVKYCVALGNEGGGTILLGVTDTRPRQVPGTPAFAEPGRTEAGLFQRLRQHIPVEEYSHEGNRVLIVHVPARLTGTAWQYKGSFWMRAGDALVPMTDEQLRRIHQETGPDFSAELCERAKLSPGGFPAGITPENVLWQQNPRNRRVAEVLGKCGLVERAGQGFDLMFRECIRQSKALPDFSRTDSNSVWLTLHGEIGDPEFLRFLEEIGRERLAAFGTDDFLVVDIVHREQPVPKMLRPRIGLLLDDGILERVGRGRSARLLLSRRFYRYLGKGGAYTRKRGLDRETNKQLLLKHIQDSESEGSKMEEFRQVLPALRRSQIQVLLRELAGAGLVHVRGTTRAARWYPGSAPADCNRKEA